jgi:hypothetical protein
MKHRRGRALRRRYGRAATSRLSRAAMIAALGLEPEGSRRSQKYDYTTSDYWKKIRFHDSAMARAARRVFGLAEPTNPWSTEKLLVETARR